MVTDKDYCDKDTAFALQELGYYPYMFYADGTPEIHLWYAQKWLRKEKSINVGANWDDDENHWYSHIKKIGSPDWSGTSVSHSCYSSYEEALSEGIKEAIKILQND